MIAVVTGGRDRTPTIAEIEDAVARIKSRGVTLVRHGDARGTDKAVASYLRARTDLVVEPWPADWDGPADKLAGRARNVAMLEGRGQPSAQLCVAFRGGRGTAHCASTAVELGLPVEWIEDVDEPRPWNRHAGQAPTPWTYVGRGTPLGNPFTIKDHGLDAMQLYRLRLWDMLRDEHPPVMAAMRAITADHHLVCSCWPRPCHVEVIVKAWRWLRRPCPARSCARVSDSMA